MENIKGNKLKIIKTAQRLFSENGYAATPISKIAKQAGVSKSLVSYHFEKKIEILNLIIKNHFSEMEKIRQKLIKKGIKKYKNKNADFSMIAEEILTMIFKKDQFWKLIVNEIIKNEQIWNNFISFIKKWHREMFKLLEKNNIIVKKKKKFIFKRMFGVFMPAMMYSIKQEKWNDFFDINNNIAKDWFIKNFENVFKNEDELVFRGCES